VSGTTRDEIEAGIDLTDAEIEACDMHLRTKMQLQGSLRGCVSYCQRQMGIGWSHALRIIEYLEACGVVTGPDARGDRDPGPNWNTKSKEKP
jgi:DNA segregation ATPase FtsK/SpoIIIE-like protein